MEYPSNRDNISARLLRETALEAAWDEILKARPFLILLQATSDVIRGAMAENIDAAMSRGVFDVGELQQAAIRALPTAAKAAGLAPPKTKSSHDSEN